MAERTGPEPMLIVGGGVAGGNAATALRDEGFRGQVVLISQEPGVPFGRPPLSKTYLRSEEDLGGWYVRPAGWYEAHGRLQVAGRDQEPGQPAGQAGDRAGLPAGTVRRNRYQPARSADGARRPRPGARRHPVMPGLLPSSA